MRNLFLISFISIFLFSCFGSAYQVLDLYRENVTNAAGVRVDGEFVFIMDDEERSSAYLMNEPSLGKEIFSGLITGATFGLISPDYGVSESASVYALEKYLQAYYVDRNCPYDSVINESLPLQCDRRRSDKQMSSCEVYRTNQIGDGMGATLGYELFYRCF